VRKSRKVQEYDTILEVSQAAWIPFEAAWEAVQALVAKLAIPD
jgi:hypothetical protein